MYKIFEPDNKPIREQQSQLVLIVTVNKCRLISVFVIPSAISGQFALASAMSIVLGMAGLAYTLNHGIFHSDLTPWLEERFWVLFHEMDYNERSARILRIIQEDVIFIHPPPNITF